MSPVLTGLTQHRAHTDPDAQDQRLRGRTYAIPFEKVWSTALTLADGGMRGWTVTASNDEAGTIDVDARTMVFKVEDVIRISVGLDANAQTRVDLVAEARSGKPDLGRNKRRIGGFLKKLDQGLDAAPGQILDPTITLDWAAAE